MLARAIAAAAMLGVTVVIAESLRAMPAGVAAVALALFGAAVAPAIASSPTPLALGLGAIGALAYAAARPAAPIPAVAIFLALVFAARAMRARSAAGIVLHFAVATIGGAGAAWVLLRFGDATPSIRVVAIGVAALLASAPFALPAEDPRVHALLALARRTRGPTRARLLRAAALRRRALHGATPLAPLDARRMERAFRTVVRLGQARVEAGAIDLGAIDRAIEAHVTALARLMRALRARWASGEAMAGHEAREIDAAGERVAAEAAALDELG